MINQSFTNHVPSKIHRQEMSIVSLCNEVVWTPFCGLEPFVGLSVGTVRGLLRKRTLTGNTKSNGKSSHVRDMQKGSYKHK